MKRLAAASPRQKRESPYSLLRQQVKLTLLDGVEMLRWSGGGAEALFFRRVLCRPSGTQTWTYQLTHHLRGGLFSAVVCGDSMKGAGLKPPLPVGGVSPGLKAGVSTRDAPRETAGVR
jgi:hypothetical protein